MSVYYDPQNLGLTVVGEVEWSEPCWDFDLTVVWFKDGEFYWASDSGCSCPSPFEGYDTLEQLETGTQHEVIAYLLSRKSNEESWRTGVDDPESFCAAQVVDLVSKIRQVGTSIIKGV